MNNECDSLDAYLAGDLHGESAVRFADHLEVCEECREAVYEQKWIDGLLQSPLRAETERVPSELLETIWKVPQSTQISRQKMVAWALAAAATILIVTGSIQLNRQASESPITDEGVARATNDADKVEPEIPRATFVSTSDSIAVPVQSKHSNVTIVRVYPAFQSRPTTQTAALEPEAASNDIWTINSSGG